MDGYLLPQIVQSAMTDNSRLDDEEYLSRIIFSEMIKDHIDGETGYGISTGIHEDIEWLVSVDVPKQKVTIKYGYDRLDIIWSGSFDEFLAANVSEEKLMKAID